jgi:thymidine kinase
MSQLQNINSGYLELILGPMFSGKSTELILQIRRYRAIKTNMIVIKPNIDVRYSQNEICTHGTNDECNKDDREKEKCKVYERTALKSVFDEKNYNDARMIAIEEGQFFTDIYEVVKRMVDVDKKIVYISALNGDFQRDIFGDIYKLISLCDNITFKQALCLVCNDGTPGIFSKRIIQNSQTSSQIKVGGAETYKAVCRKHFFE